MKQFIIPLILLTLLLSFLYFNGLEYIRNIDLNRFDTDSLI